MVSSTYGCCKRAVFCLQISFRSKYYFILSFSTLSESVAVLTVGDDGSSPLHHLAMNSAVSDKEFVKVFECMDMMLQKGVLINGQNEYPFIIYCL